MPGGSPQGKAPPEAGSAFFPADAAGTDREAAGLPEVGGEALLLQVTVHVNPVCAPVWEAGSHLLKNRLEYGQQSLTQTLCCSEEDKGTSKIKWWEEADIQAALSQR